MNNGFTVTAYDTTDHANDQFKNDNVKVELYPTRYLQEAALSTNMDMGIYLYGGGYGTIYQCVMTIDSISGTSKPIYILNTENYYKKLINFFNSIEFVDNRASRTLKYNNVCIVKNSCKLIKFLNNCNEILNKCNNC